MHQPIATLIGSDTIVQLRYGTIIYTITNDISEAQLAQALVILQDDKIVKVTRTLHQSLNNLARLGLPCVRSIDLDWYAKDRDRTLTGQTHADLLREFQVLQPLIPARLTARTHYNYNRDAYLTVLSLSNEKDVDSRAFLHPQSTLSTKHIKATLIKLGLLEGTCI